jgi:flavin reductase (DIM6/NTAB) family NADH-FMN oxidoreductase RutF
VSTEGNSATESSTVELQRLRECFGAYGTGVAVLTTHTSDGEPCGLTANSFTSLSLDPPLILWSISRKAQSYAAFMSSERFAVNVLACDQIDFAQRFARKSSDKFTGVPYRRGRHGAPLLENCTAWLECSTFARHDGGDHTIIIGRVDTFDRFDRPGLLFVRGRFCQALSD